MRIDKALLLRDLLLTTKDGDWGQDAPREGFVPYRVIRGGDFPLVRIGEISTIPLRYLDSGNVHKRTLVAGDIIIETAGGNRDRPTGRVLLVTGRILRSLNLPATCASFSRFLRVDPQKAEPRYVFWYLQYLYDRGDMWQHQVQHTGVARFQFTRFAETVSIPLPDRSEQEAIACILGALDEKIELNWRVNRTLEAMAKAIFKSWFVDFDPVVAKADGRKPFGMDDETAALFPDSFQDSSLGRNPRGWKVGKVADVCTSQYGYTASASAENIGPHLLRVTDMNKEPWIEWSTVPYCRISEKDLPRYQLSIADILVSRMADPGKAAIVEESVTAVFASYLIRLVTSEPNRAYHLFYFLRSSQYLDYAEGATGGTVQANMNANVITAADMVIPPAAVAEAFNEEVRPLRRNIVANLAQSRTLAILRNTLLPKLLSGEVRLMDAERIVGKDEEYIGTNG